MDRNDRRHLPGFHEMIARGERHARFGGPDHVDASPVMKPKEPVGSVFGYTEPAPIHRQIVHSPPAHEYYKSPDQGVPQMFSNVEADCAPILEHGPVSSRGLTNLNVDPVRANFVEKQWKKQQDRFPHSCDSGFSGSLNSAQSLNSKDETEIVPQLQNLSLGKEPNLPIFECEKQKQERFVISSDEEPSLDSVNSLNSLNTPFNSDRIDKPTDTVEEYTAKFNRNLKYFEQDKDLET